MSFRNFDLANDVASIQSGINEVVLVQSQSFVSGVGDANIKFFTNIASSSAAALGGYWQTVYDMSPTASNATALFDMTFGYTTGSVYNATGSVSSSQNEKIKVYREITNILQGNSDLPFTFNGVQSNECFFILLKRGLMKDEVKKGSVGIVLSGVAAAPYTASDTGAATSFKQTVGGDYAPLYSGSTEVGQVWYQAGIIVIPATGSGLPWGGLTADWNANLALTSTMYSGTIDQNVTGLRAHVRQVGFHNQTNLYSTVYFCRATNAEFNYSSNPTFLDSDKRIRVTSGSNVVQTRTYITTIGLYDANDNLLAVGKLNKPITKTPDNESIFRIRLDY
jgi:hypothetical protein